MHDVGNINKDMFAEISTDVTTNEVIITDDRIEHSNLHNNAYEKYGDLIPDVLANPDVVYQDKRPYTAIMLKQIQDNGKTAQLVLRLHVSSDNPEYKNSIISFWDISDKRRQSYERNKKIIYKNSEV